MKSYATAREILIHSALSEVNQIYSTFMILIVIFIGITIIIIIIIIIIIQIYCKVYIITIKIILIIIAIIINSTKDDSWGMNELFHKLKTFGEQSS